MGNSLSQQMQALGAAVDAQKDLRIERDRLLKIGTMLDQVEGYVEDLSALDVLEAAPDDVRLGIGVGESDLPDIKGLTTAALKELEDLCSAKGSSWAESESKDPVRLWADGVEWRQGRIAKLNNQVRQAIQDQKIATLLPFEGRDSKFKQGWDLLWAAVDGDRRAQDLFSVIEGFPEEDGGSYQEFVTAVKNMQTYLQQRNPKEHEAEFERFEAKAKSKTGVTFDEFETVRDRLDTENSLDDYRVVHKTNIKGT